jgi:hypothetical protein
VRVGPVEGITEAAHCVAGVAALRDWLRRSLGAPAAG